MTIKQFAQEHGVSCQAVYQKLKKNGLKIDNLVNHDNPNGKRELTDEGHEKLKKLFTETVNSKPMLDKLEKEADQLRNQVENLEAENAQLKQELADARQRETSATDKIISLTDQLMNATRDAQNLAREAQRLADQAQQLELARLTTQQQTIKALPGGGVKGWFSKLFKKGDGE